MKTKKASKRRNENHIAHKLIVLLLVASVIAIVASFQLKRAVAQNYKVSSNGFTVESYLGQIPELSAYTASTFGEGQAALVYVTLGAVHGNAEVYANITLSSECNIFSSSSQTTRLKLEPYTVNYYPSGPGPSNDIRAEFRLAARDDFVKSARECTVTVLTESPIVELNNHTLTLNVPVQDNDSTTKTYFFGKDSLKTLVESRGSSVNSWFSLSISDWPQNPVEVTASSNGQCGIDVAGNGRLAASKTVTFTNSSSKYTAFLLGAYDDYKVEGNHTCVISFAVKTNDPDYVSIGIPSLKVGITDNDSSVGANDNSEVDTDEKQPNVNHDEVVGDPNMSDNLVRLTNSKGESFAVDEIDKTNVFDLGEPITLSGITNPSNIVKLYIFSTPREVEVVADAEGYWQYTVHELEPGDHRVEMEVYDSNRQLVSERSQIVAFAVDDNSFNNSRDSRVVVLIATSVLLVASAGILFMKISKGKPVKYIKHLVRYHHI